MNIMSYQFFLGPLSEGPQPPPPPLLVTCGYTSVLVPQAESPGGGTPFGANLGEPKKLC